MTVKMRPGVLITDTEYGTALLDEDSGTYWTLNDSATVILRALTAGGDTEAAVTALSGEYDVDPVSARHDVRDLVDALRDAGLIER